MRFVVDGECVFGLVIRAGVCFGILFVTMLMCSRE